MRFFVSILLIALLSAREAGGEYPKVLPLVHMPEAFSKMVSGHLEKIRQKGWAEVAPGDLYHAHVLLPPGPPLPEGVSLEELLSRAVAILYHSDEQLFRWRLEDGDLPVEKRRPRSIIGYPDGRVAPAAELFADPLNSAPDYEWHGTIHSDDLSQELPERFAPRADRVVATFRGLCRFNLLISISPGHPPDPTVIVGGKEFTITMDCGIY